MMARLLDRATVQYFPISFFMINNSGTIILTNQPNLAAIFGSMTIVLLIVTLSVFVSNCIVIDFKMYLLISYTIWDA